MTRAPVPRLRPFVRRLWLSDRRTSQIRVAARENVLPTGDMHLVFRLTDDPVRLFSPDNATSALDFGHAVIGGPRTMYYTKDALQPALSVGAQLKPGAAEALFGVAANEFADRHVRLADLWGRSASRIRDRLMEARDPEQQLLLLESVLSGRLPAIAALHPAVAGALQHFGTSGSVREAVRQSGYSHRGFVALFRRAVGLGPKVYTRIMRFQRVLAEYRTRDTHAVSWADLALCTGYSDQAHFNREFREFAGVTPEFYRRAAPDAPHHLVLDSQ